MEMSTVPSGVMHRGVELHTATKDMEVDQRWQVNQVFSRVKSSHFLGSLVGLLATLGGGATVLAVSTIAGTSPNEAGQLLGIFTLGSAPITFPFGFSLMRRNSRKYHYLAAMNKMGIFDKSERKAFMKTVKSLKIGESLFVQTPPSRGTGDIGIWKINKKEFSFYGMKPADGGWDAALSEVVSFYGLATMDYDDFEDELDYEDELDGIGQEKIMMYEAMKKEAIAYYYESLLQHKYYHSDVS